MNMWMRLWAPTVLAVLSLCCMARAALPPAYGGDVRLAALEPIELPHPAERNSPFQASLVSAVYDSLGDAVTVEADGTSARLRFRPDIVRHDRRPLRPSDLIRSLRRLERSSARHWLAPIARSGSRLLMTVEDTSVVVRLRESVNVERWLRAAPLAFRAAPGTGTGPFRPRVVLSLIHI